MTHLQSVGEEVGGVDGEEVPAQIRGHGGADGGLGGAWGGWARGEMGGGVEVRMRVGGGRVTDGDGWVIMRVRLGSRVSHDGKS